jgi:2-dehydropantoate 2-reductase
MKIGVVGCGALGSYYGAKLCRAGQDVHFLLCSDYDVVREQGVRIESPAGDFTAYPHAATAPEQIGVCDLVLIGLKTTANSAFNHLLPPMVGDPTLVLTLQNGLGNEEALARVVSAEQILGGLCFVCLNRIRPGFICHTDHGHVVIGEFGRGPLLRTQAIAEMFQQAGIQCSISDNLGKAHWEKLVWNVPFNGLGVAAMAGLEAMVTGVVPAQIVRHKCFPTDELLADAHWAALVRGLMLEVIHAAGKLGYAIPETLADRMIERTRTMGTYRASTLIDFERGQPLELESLFVEPLCRAQQAGAETPLLKQLCAVLTELDRRRAAGVEWN